VPALTADGGERQIEMVLSVLDQRNGSQLLVATLRDVSDRLDLVRQSALAHHLLGLLGEETGEEELTDRMLGALGESLDMAATALWSPDGSPGTLVCAGFWHPSDRPMRRLAEASAQARFGRGEGLPGRVWASGRPEWISDLDHDSNFPRHSEARADGLRSAFAFPISAQGRRQGVIELFATRRSVPDPALLATMQVVGSRLGEFVQRVHLDQERRRMAEREREIATSLQRSLLPPSLPRIPGVDLGAAFHPGGELVVGGDFYDVFVVDSPGAPASAERSGPRVWGVAIGDVCGTGPEAAAVTAQVRHTARALARGGAGPAEILANVNAALLDTDDSRFCTCIFALLTVDDDGVRLRIANAGHPRPVRYRADGRVEELEVGGPLLGVFEQFSVEEHSVDLRPGEGLVFYTDGVTEARAGGEQFGEARLHEVLRHAARRPAADVAFQLEQTARRFASGEVDDDIAVLVVAAEPLAPTGSGELRRADAAGASERPS
jgi:serine phosphatase RsbU (regulator of sigma subunit)